MPGSARFGLSNGQNKAEPLLDGGEGAIPMRFPLLCGAVGPPPCVAHEATQSLKPALTLTHSHRNMFSSARR